MTQFFMVHPDNPQARLIRQAAFIVSNGGLIVFPTDSGYAMGCRIDAVKVLKRIKKIRQLDDSHEFSLIFSDLSTLQQYAVVDNNIYRILRAYTPGSYTFILLATKLVPRKMLKPNKKTVGLRIPNNKIMLTLLDTLDMPLLTTSLILPNSEFPLCEPSSIKDILGSQVDLIIDGGNCPHEPTTIVDLTDRLPKIIRVGSGDPEPFRI
ncbi:MAG: threonylcarbamoyl-AMP synthase [Legionellales bacterium]|nr:threonylcarbamoyl-AMP synthase [Legionellales bacterium]